MKNYGKFGGQYVSKELKIRLDEIANAFNEAKKDKNFVNEYLNYLNQYVGRPTPLYYAKRLTEYAKGAKIYLKREDLNHTGAHKINNALGQILLAKRMGKKHAPYYRIVAADSRSPRDGRIIEEIGTYNPIKEEGNVTVNKELALKWLKNGAKPTDTVRNILSKEGIMKEFHESK